MITIKPYPKRPLVDSSVLIEAWRTAPSSAELAADCLDFLVGVENSDGSILVAAPTVSELLKGTPPLDLPRRRSVVPVPFDRRAARTLGKEFPANTLKILRKEAGNPVGAYFKYDALIVACAKSANADCIITLNLKDFGPLAKHVGLPCRSPTEYRQPKQVVMALPHPKP